MTRVRHCLAIVTVACLTSIGPVQADDSAGVLREVQGTALVNQGKNHVVGYSGMQLKPGARVLTMDGASAVINRTDGSQTELEPNSLFTQRDLSTYRGGADTVRNIGPSGTETLGTDAMRHVPTVAPAITHDIRPPIDAVNPALGGGAGAVTWGARAIEAPPLDVGAEPPPVSPFR